MRAQVPAEGVARGRSEGDCGEGGPEAGQSFAKSTGA